MQIQRLNIDRFGRKSDLHLDGISGQLNVVYGPNGAGKSTTINFLRWMLYGNYDERVGQYVSGTYRNVDGALSAPAAGALTFSENGHVRRLARQDDGSRYGRVAIDNETPYARQSHHLASWLSDVSQTDFDLLFTPDFSREYALAELLQGSMARGIDLVSHRIPSDRVQELRLRIDNYRRDMDGLPWRSGDLTALLEQKRNIERRLDALAEDMRRRRVEYDLEYTELDRRIQETEQEIERLRGDWHARDSDVVARRRELEEAWDNAEEAKQDYIRRRRNELVEMDAHVTRVRAMQTDIQRRYDRLQASLRDHEIDLDRSRDPDESACLVQSISKQLDDMRDVEYPESEYINRYRRNYRYRGAASPMNASLDHLRNEVGRLCQTLQREKSDDRVRAMADELDQLRECESMMQRWLTGLISQRDQLANEIDEAERHGVSLVIDDPNFRRDLHREYDRLRDLEIYEPLRAGRLRAVGHSCDGYEPIDPVSDELLIKLTRHRDAVRDELNAAERLLQQLMQRRHDLESALSRLSDRELEAAKRELPEVESLIRAAEERERLQRLISETEYEISRLRDTVRNSPVTDHAAKILYRLTAGQYQNIRIDSTRNISIEDASGTNVPVEHVSRGTRDQVYLSFCLALITEYRRRGVRLPFVLNDAFVNVDSQSDDRLAGVLGEFASMGQQVLVFTRHEHVADMMRQVGAQYLELRHQSVVQPTTPPPTLVRTESIDQVRFRPRSEGYFTKEVTDPRSRTHVREVESFQPDVHPQPGPRPPVRPHRESVHREIRRSDETRYDDYREFDELSGQIPASAFEPRRNPSSVIIEPAPATFVQPASMLHSNQPLDAATALARTALVRETGTVDADLAARLDAIGIITVDDFLQAAPAQIEHDVDGWGLTARPIRRWQSQLALRVDVPGIGAEDARILVACGIDSPKILAKADVDVLCDRVIQLLTTQRGADRGHRRTREHYRNRIQDWILRASRSYRVLRSEQAPPYEHRGGPRFRDREYDQSTYFDDDGDSSSRNTSRSSRSSRSTGRRSENGERSSRNSRKGSGNGSSSRASRSASSRTTSRPRSGESEQRTRSERSSRKSRSSRTSTGSRELRFYLNKSDPVVDAPTIGPKMAERLQKIGIVTVDDLLQARPADVATQMDYSKVDAAEVKIWQQQANLACRIPQMRGHDAQILVACGIADPTKLAAMDADTLWGTIQPFTKTAECKRIIRNGKAPDRDEILDWIEWAQSARTLAAA